MDTEEIELKRLAEGYHYNMIDLKESEFNALKNSKYSHLLREKEYKPKFEKVLESFNKNENKNSYKKRIKPYGHSHYFNINTSRSLIQDLIDRIEKEFDLGIDNDDIDKYEKVSLDDLKDFVRYYSIKNHKNHMETIKRIENVFKNASSVEDLVLELYSYLI